MPCGGVTAPARGGGERETLNGSAGTKEQRLVSRAERAGAAASCVAGGGWSARRLASGRCRVDVGGQGCLVNQGKKDLRCKQVALAT